MPARRKPIRWTFSFPMAAVRCQKGKRLTPPAPVRPPHAYYCAADKAIYVKPATRRRLIAHLRARIDAKGQWHFVLSGRRRKARRKVVALELAWRLWDPSNPPEEGDVRFKDARCINVTRQLNCELVPGTTPPLYLSSDPVMYGQCLEAAPRTCTEIYSEILTKPQVRVYDDAACTKLSNMNGCFHIFDWTCLEL